MALPTMAARHRTLRGRNHERSRVSHVVLPPLVLSLPKDALSPLNNRVRLLLRARTGILRRVLLKGLVRALVHRVLLVVLAVQHHPPTPPMHRLCTDVPVS